MNNQGTLLRLLNYSINEKKHIIISTILLIIAVVLEMAGPWLIMIFIDQHLISNQMEMTDILPLLAMYITTLLLANIAYYYQSLTYYKLSARILFSIRSECFDKLMGLPMAYFHKTQVGAIIARMTLDTEAIRNLYRNIIGRTIKDIVTLIAVIIAMFLLDVQLALICIAFTPIFITIFYLYRQWALPLHRQIKQLASEFSSFFNESLQQMLVIQVFNAQPTFMQKLENKCQKNIELNKKNVVLEALMLRPMLELLSLVMMSFLLLSFGFSATSGLQVGVIFAFFGYLARFFEPLINLMQSQGDLLQSLAAGERVFELLDEQSETKSGSLLLENKAQQVDFKKLSFSYPGNNLVLKDINLRFAAGEFIALVGPTGSGKSSLINLLKGFYQAQHGNIFISGKEINAYCRYSLRRHFSLVEQTPFIMNATLQENLTLGADSICSTVQENALKEAQLWNWYQTLPQGLSTPLGNGKIELSVGQKQLLSFARALTQKSPVIILDEASANLDAESESAMNKVLRNLRGKVSLIVIAHKLNTIKEANQILVLKDGEICERGRHHDLLAHGGVYEQLYKAS
jgi:ATP-binding cassette subfamily B multidrug efflux pump